MSDPAIIPATLPPQAPRFDRTIFALIILLFFFVTALFSSLAEANFINLDDPMYVTNNPHVTGGLTSENIAWAWSEDGARYSGYWIPLTWMSLQLDGSLSDPTVPPPLPHTLKDAPPRFPNASVYHIDNLFQHGLAAVILFLFLWRATGLRWPAFAATLLWAVHPLRVESFAWVTERKDMLSAIFGFLALLLYIEWARSGKWWRYTACVLVFALSLMAKPLFVSIPLILVFMDFWPLKRIQGFSGLGRSIAEKTPLWILAVAASVLVVITQGMVKSVTSLSEIPLGERIGHATVAYAGYLWNQIHVWELGLVYPYKPNSAGEIFLSAVVLLVITALCIWQAKRRPWFIVGWLWYLVTMAPLIGIVQAGDQGSADRFTYRPSIGLFIMLAFGVWEIWEKKPAIRRIIGIAAFALLAYFAGFAAWQAAFWNNTIALMNHSFVSTGDNFLMHGYLGSSYVTEGQNELAADEFQKVVDLKPKVVAAWVALGQLHLAMGDNSRAILDLQRAVQLNLHDSQSLKLYGIALLRGGYLKEAEYELHAAVYFGPKDAEAAKYWEIAKQQLARQLATQPATSASASQHAPPK